MNTNFFHKRAEILCSKKISICRIRYSCHIELTGLYIVLVSPIGNEITTTICDEFMSGRIVISISMNLSLI